MQRLRIKNSWFLSFFSLKCICVLTTSCFLILLPLQALGCRLIKLLYCLNHPFESDRAVKTGFILWRALKPLDIFYHSLSLCLNSITISLWELFCIWLLWGKQLCDRRSRLSHPDPLWGKVVCQQFAEGYGWLLTSNFHKQFAFHWSVCV